MQHVGKEAFLLAKGRSSSRHTQPHSRKPLLLLLLIFLVAAAAVGIYMLDTKEPAPQTQEAALPVNTATATIAAVGDLTISDALAADTLQSDGSYDFGSCLYNAAPLLSADLTIGNLELTFSGEPYGGSTYSAPESLAATLSTLGFDILQTANSKSLAGGISGLRSTLDTLAVNGIDALGTYATQQARDSSGRVLLREVNGIRFAFFAYTKGFDGMSIPTGSEYCANVLYKDYDTAYSEIDKADILSVIQEAKALEPDVIIAMVHWGSEYRMTVSKTQKELADLLFTNGVDVILGTHSHMVGPMETRTVTRDDGTEKEVFLAYSLGNFLASDTEAYTQDGIVLNLTFTKDLDTGTTSLSATDYTPIYLADYGEGVQNRFRTMGIEQSLQLYDELYIGRVSEGTRDAMLEALEDLEANMAPQEEPPPEDSPIDE